MPEKKVQRIEKIQFANMGYKAVGIYARVSTCQPFHLHSMAMQVSALTNAFQSEREQARLETGA